MTDTEQRAKWLKMADDIGIVADDDEVVALCEASVATERSRLAAAGEITDDDIGHIGASYRADRTTETTHLHFTRQGFREVARVLITESAARATVAERERRARWHDKEAAEAEEKYRSFVGFSDIGATACLQIAASHRRSAAAIRAGKE